MRIFDHRCQHHLSRVARGAWLLLAALTVAGCAGSVKAPVYQRPAVAEKSDWSETLGAQRHIEQDWWRGFGDPYLNGLVDQAVADNVDLRVFAARSDLAEAQIGQARAALLPAFNLGARTDTTNITGDFDLGTSSKFGVGGDLAWELDIWGKARKGVQAQKSAYRASEADYRAAYLALVSSVINTYFLIRQTDAQIVQQGRSLARSQQLLEIYEDMHTSGLVPESDVKRQHAEVADIRSSLRELQRGRKLSENSLATLLGVPAGDFSVPETSEFMHIEAVPVPAGLPAELLNRRPDIVAAEHRLEQSVALEGQARLAQLPSIGLTGLGGSASFGLSNLLKTWTAGLSSVLEFPVFDPNVRARIPVSEAQVEVAEQEYRTVVMRAFEEVENALVTLSSRREQQADLEQRRTDLEFVAEQFDERLRLGLISQLDVLEASRALLDAEQKLLANQWQILSDTVSLFKAVGGGWPPENADS